MWHPPLLQLTGESNRRSAAVHYPKVHIRNLDQVRVSLLQICLCRTMCCVGDYPASILHSTYQELVIRCQRAYFLLFRASYISLSLRSTIGTHNASFHFFLQPKAQNDSTNKIQIISTQLSAFDLRSARAIRFVWRVLIITVKGPVYVSNKFQRYCCSNLLLPSLFNQTL